MKVTLQLSMCLRELQGFVVYVYDHLFSHNALLPLPMLMHNGVHILVLGGLLLNNIK